MNLQRPLDELPSLNLPRPTGPQPKIPAPPRAESEGMMRALRYAGRRGLLTGFSGGTLGTPPAEPQRTPHRDPVLSLVHRITQGFNVDEYERAQALGYEAYLEEQLDPLAIDDSVMDARLANNAPTLFLSPKQLYDTYSADFTEPYTQFKGAMLQRSTNSKRQLFERMCEFWSDHFNIDHNKGNLEWVFLPEHDQRVIRAHALGTFPELLSACAFSPAMLYYLDNWLNVQGAPQENYARELMELHTLSIHGGYHESDVQEVAKCFTGWTLNSHPSSPDWMRTHFDMRLHTGGSKFVLGHEIRDPLIGQPGQPRRSLEAQKVLDILAAHPSTADFLARKLLHWFLTPTPPEALVAQVAQTYLDTQGDIKSMLRVILARANMRWISPVLQPKFRRPFHYLISLYRTIDAVLRRPEESLSHVSALGQTPYDFPFPTGYPDTVEAWGGLLLPRWIFAAYLFRPAFSSGIAGVNHINVPGLKARIGFQDASDRPGLARRINERLLGGALSPHEEESVQGYIDNYPAAYDVTFALFDTLALAVSLPGFQSY